MQSSDHPRGLTKNVRVGELRSSSDEERAKLIAFFRDQVEKPGGQFSALNIKPGP